MLNLRSVIKPEIQSTMKPKKGYTVTLILDILQRLPLLQIFFYLVQKNSPKEMKWLRITC